VLTEPQDVQQKNKRELTWRHVGIGLSEQDLASVVLRSLLTSPSDTDTQVNMPQGNIRLSGCRSGCYSYIHSTLYLGNPWQNHQPKASKGLAVYGDLSVRSLFACVKVSE